MNALTYTFTCPHCHGAINVAIIPSTNVLGPPDRIAQENMRRARRAALAAGYEYSNRSIWHKPCLEAASG